MAIKKKKIFKISLLCLLAIVILSLLICGGYVGYTFLETKNIELKSEPQIKADAAILDADISYAMTDLHASKKISRLGYNQNAPIKVVLRNNLEERTKKVIRQAYTDILNPVMEQINNKYCFEVVNEKDLKRTSADKVMIRFESGKEPKGIEVLFAPLATTNYNYLNAFINPVLTDVKIIINEFFFDEETTDERILHIIVHEILHTLGFTDVYDVENYGTMLKTDLNNELFKPNDIKALAALYFEDYDNLEKLQDWILSYTDDFYQKYSNLFLDAEIYEYEAVGDGFFILKGSLEIIGIDVFDALNFMGESEIYGLKYKFIIQNENFYYSLTDINTQKVLDERVGKYYFYGGKIFLGIFDMHSGEDICRAELVIVNTENGFELLCIKNSLARLNYTEKIILHTIS